MSREKELAKNTFVLSLGKFLPKLVSMVTLPIVTGCLTKAEYGTYDLIATLIMLLLPIATLQIQSAAFRFLIDRRDNYEESAKVISNIYLVTVPISVVVSSVLPFFLSGLTTPEQVIIVLYFIADMLYTTTAQVARGLSYNRLYSISAVTVSVIDGIGIVVAVLLMDTGLLGVLISLLLANIVAFLYLAVWIKLSHFFKLKYRSTQMIKELLVYSWPMVPNNLSSWVLKMSDRLVITAVLGVEANAVYAVANKIPNLLSIAQSVMVMAWHENASIAVGDKDAAAYYSKMFDTIFCLMCGCTAVLVSFTPILFALLIRGDYQDAYIQMPILILGMFFYCMSSFQGGIYIAHKKTKSVGITTMVAAGVNLLIDLAFVNVIGITAGSFSTLIAYFVLYTYRMFDVKRFQEIHYNYIKVVGLILLLIVILILCSLQLLWVNVLNMVLGCAILFVLNRELISEFVKSGMKMLRRK